MSRLPGLLSDRGSVGDLWDLHTPRGSKSVGVARFQFHRGDVRNSLAVFFLGVLLFFSPVPGLSTSISGHCSRSMRSGGGFRVWTRRQLEAGVGLFNFAGPMLRLGRLFLL